MDYYEINAMAAGRREGVQALINSRETDVFGGTPDWMVKPAWKL